MNSSELPVAWLQGVCGDFDGGHHSGVGGLHSGGGGLHSGVGVIGGPIHGGGGGVLHDGGGAGLHVGGGLHAGE